MSKFGDFTERLMEKFAAPENGVRPRRPMQQPHESPAMTEATRTQIADELDRLLGYYESTHPKYSIVSANAWLDVTTYLGKHVSEVRTILAALRASPDEADARRLDWRDVNTAAKAANADYGQWMPERWVQRFFHHYNAALAAKSGGASG